MTREVGCTRCIKPRSTPITCSRCYGCGSWTEVRNQKSKIKINRDHTANRAKSPPKSKRANGGEEKYGTMWRKEVQRTRSQFAWALLMGFFAWWEYTRKTQAGFTQPEPEAAASHLREGDASRVLARDTQRRIAVDTIKRVCARSKRASRNVRRKWWKRWGKKQGSNGEEDGEETREHICPICCKPTPRLAQGKKKRRTSKRASRNACENEEASDGEKKHRSDRWEEKKEGPDARLFANPQCSHTPPNMMGSKNVEGTK
ncbi:hypothetical protein C8J57DRAFT_1647287 [Mycena rebaudengoi]|nr:hypothetical protein C8J57DRAFT_1647287 [Mycena rebaudengoi]